MLSNTVCNISIQTLKAQSVIFTCVYWYKKEQKIHMYAFRIEIH